MQQVMLDWPANLHINDGHLIIIICRLLPSINVQCSRWLQAWRWLQLKGSITIARWEATTNASISGTITTIRGQAACQSDAFQVHQRPGNHNQR